MKKLTLRSPDQTARNIERLAELFPSAVTESRDADGVLKHAIDFDLLRQELSSDLVEGERERYRLDWPGKRAALLRANEPIDKTLRPDRDASVNFDTTKNLFIEGDNLDALKLLQESYLGKVKLIYIDPPYNTGNDFIYNDDFKTSSADYAERSGEIDHEGGRLVANTESNGRFHSDWLSMMYPRLKLARNLLRDDGVIFISIDDHEGAALRSLCDAVFGAVNFVATVVWHRVHTLKNSARHFSEDHDYVLVYARHAESWLPNPLPRTSDQDARYSNPDSDPRGPWISSPMHARNRYDAGQYAVTTPSGREIAGPPTGRYWSVSSGKLAELDADNRIWWGIDGTGVPRLKRFLSEADKGRTPQTLWPHSQVGHTQAAKASLVKHVSFEYPENVLTTVKPVALLQRVLQLATNSVGTDIVLDFFSGSGTTAHALLEQNATDGGDRRFIAVQAYEPLPKPEPGFDTIFGMSLARTRSAGSELSGQRTELDSGFRVLRVDSSNLANVDRVAIDTAQGELIERVETVRSDRTSEDVLFQVLAEWGLDLTSPLARTSNRGYDVFNVDEGALILTMRSPNSSIEGGGGQIWPSSRKGSPASSRCAPSSSTPTLRRTRSGSMLSSCSVSTRRTRRCAPYDRVAQVDGRAI